ncbi:MAG: Peptidase propeptide, partial [Nevskia sp.]|nr:Peptidase propeptide [Nevskia sp.]
MSKHLLAGSERQALAGVGISNPARPDERLEVSLHLRRRDAEAFSAHLGSRMAGRSKCLAREEFASRFGAAPEDIAAVKTFAGQAGLSVVRADAARRIVVLSGTVAQFNAAFGVDLQMFEHPNGSYRGRNGAIYLPENLAGIVQAVLGLDNRPQAVPHFRMLEATDKKRRAAAGAGSFTPLELASLYRFPDGTGAGQCIAIIELGGGYETADLTTYFSGLGLSPPQVAAISVDNAQNQPSGDPNSADGEVMLDIEVAGAIAPAARLAVYFAPNTDAGFLDAITTAIHDTQNKPSVISISWGGPESSWTQQAMTSFDDAFQSAAALGITVCVAAGDGGSSDGASDGAAHVDFPASSPYALACGGTSLNAQGTSIASESVWNDGSSGGATGGGVSSFFALPDWQAQLKVVNGQSTSAPLTMRGVPDVAGDADPQTGYAIRVDGTDAVFGGTSAVAPLWAGLVARINANKGSPLGFLNPKLYPNASAFNDVVDGN